jgi:hypothetical protein
MAQNLDPNCFNLDLFFVRKYKSIRTYHTSLRYYTNQTLNPIGKLCCLNQW